MPEPWESKDEVPFPDFSDMHGVSLDPSINVECQVHCGCDWPCLVKSSINILDFDGFFEFLFWDFVFLHNSRVDKDSIFTRVNKGFGVDAFFGNSYWEDNQLFADGFSHHCVHQ